MSPEARRNLVLLGIVLVILVLCIAFPSVLAFLELGARQLRYYWWLLALLVAGAWLVFFAGRKDR